MIRPDMFGEEMSYPCEETMKLGCGQGGDTVHFGIGNSRGENIFENDGYIVHFFSKENIEKIRGGFNIVDIKYFEEAELPRKLYCVIMQK